MTRDINRREAIKLTGALTLSAAIGCNSLTSTKKEKSLKPGLKVIDRGIVYNGQENPDRRSSAFPQVCAMPDGTWLCGFRAAPTKIGNIGQHVLISRSEDQGRTWSRPESFFTPPDIDGKPGRFRACAMTALGKTEVLATLYWVDDSHPELPFFNEQTQGLLDSRIFLSRSANGGRSWSVPRLIDTSPFHMPTPITGPVLVLPDGNLACQFELSKSYYDTAAWQHRSVLMISHDGGNTFTDHIITSSDPENRIFYWDQRPAVMPDGGIFDLFWTYDNRTGQYLNIHARRSESDYHRWSEIQDTGVPGQPAPPVPLKNNLTAMVYVDRTGVPIIKARLSEDGGRTWPAETEIIVYQTKISSQTRNKQTLQDSLAEMSAFSLGLPQTAGINDHEFIVVFYAGSHPDRTAIHWARLTISSH